jgi:hypothetical protein
MTDDVAGLERNIRVGSVPVSRLATGDIPKDVDITERDGHYARFIGWW